MVGLEGWQLAAVLGVSSYHVAKRVPAVADREVRLPLRLGWSVLVFNWNGALKVTPLSVERM